MAMKNVQDFYPLSPMQQGMLFHSLLAPEAGMYIEQLSCTLRGDLDVSAFTRAWQRVVDRHPILRTAFIGEGLKEPIQVVHRRVRLPIEQQDWRTLPPAEQEARLERFLEAERQRGFQLSKPPLMRLALIRVEERAYKFVWTHHHLLMDGWSLPILLQEVLAFYEAFRQGRDLYLPPSRPYRDYIVWLKKQDMARAEAFWRRLLKGFTAPTPLTVDRRPAGDGDGSPPEETDYRKLDILLSAETTAALQALARQHQLTLNTLVQGAWALLLSRYSGEDDVVFGATVSGR
ncbi:MAG: non-ribosomal peptide synthetase, partial [Chloroflexi bacterium]